MARAPRILARMAVLLANTTLTLHARVHPDAEDARGVPVQTAAGEQVRGPLPGAVQEQQDGTWTLRLEPELGPAREGDKVVDAQGRQFILTGNPRAFQVPGYPDADYIGATATLDPPKVR